MAPHARIPRSRQFAELKRTIGEICTHPRDSAHEVSEFAAIYWRLACVQGYPDADATMAEIARYYRHRDRRRSWPRWRLR